MSAEVLTFDEIAPEQPCWKCGRQGTVTTRRATQECPQCQGKGWIATTFGERILALARRQLPPPG
jgi:Zn finger protein HypA/HybF involved in hydrogenase expression